MNRLQKTLIVGSALSMLMAAPAFAAASNSGHGRGPSAQAEVVNGQVNLGDVWSNINTTARDVHGSFEAQATSVGNTVQIVTFADSIVTNDQSNEASIGSSLRAKASGVGGDVELSATSVCNDAGVSTDPHLTSVKSWQWCGQGDPSAHVDANVSYAGGVGIAATAIGNQLEVDSNASRFPVDSTQINGGPVISSVNAQINHTGPASVTATSVGNTAQIVHY